MEKLQKALQKAREQRGGQSALHITDDTDTIVGSANTAPQHGAGPQNAETISGDAEALWKALTAFDPPQKVLERNRIVTATAQRDGTPFDILRTKILLAMRKNGWTRLAVTSPTMGCGKTTTACNLAIGFARSPDMRSMLLEFDLRRPNVANTLGLPEGVDITEMLLGHVPFAEQALRYRDNVAISAAHTVCEDPSSLLTSRVIQGTLERIEAEYAADLMIFDLPPLLVGDDTRAVLKDVDCALMVARAEQTTVSQIDTCEREIAEHTNMLGVVLNHCRDVDDDYGYYE